MTPKKWNKIGVLAACVVALPVAWIVNVRLVDVSRTPEEVNKLRTDMNKGFEQVNRRLDGISYQQLLSTNQTNKIATND